MVRDIRETRAALLDRGVEVIEIDEQDMGIKYASFSDLDGNTWALQEIPPGI